MRRIGLIMACGALALGCNNGGRGGEDSGGIMLMDAGDDEDDAGGNTDPDAGPVGCSVAGETGFPALPDECVPRCAEATGTCVMGCADGACQNTCIANDTMAGTTIDYGGGESDQLDCQGCWNWGINHCVYRSCETQLGACLACADGCDPEVAGCETEEVALDMCVDDNLTMIQTCFSTQALRCF